jgi:hypothetical protein
MPEIEWPSVQDVSVSFVGAQYLYMRPGEFGVFARIVWCIATAGTFGFYSNRVPDLSIPFDDKEAFFRVTGCSADEWAGIEDMMLHHFVVVKGRLRLRDESIVHYSRRSARVPIPMAVKAEVAARDGHRCSYCGSVEGPFHFDHLFPVSRGGSNEASNIVVACSVCNLSKSDATLMEWVERLRGAR